MDSCYTTSIWCTTLAMVLQHSEKAGQVQPLHGPTYLFLRCPHAIAIHQSAKCGRFRRDLVGAGVRYPPKSWGQSLKIWGIVRHFGADVTTKYIYSDWWCSVYIIQVWNIPKKLVRCSLYMECHSDITAVTRWMTVVWGLHYQGHRSTHFVDQHFDESKFWYSGSMR